MPKGQAAVMYTSHLHIQNTLFNSHVNSIISDKHLRTGWLWNVIHDVLKITAAVKIDKCWKFNILFVWDYKTINDFDSSEISFKYASKLKITDNIIHNWIWYESNINVMWVQLSNFCKNISTPTRLDMLAHLRTHYMILSKQLCIHQLFTSNRGSFLTIIISRLNKT